MPKHPPILDWKAVLVVAPHPDDEVLGCGGTIRRLRDSGVEVHITFVTRIPTELQRATESMCNILEPTATSELDYADGSINLAMLDGLVPRLRSIAISSSFELVLIPHQSDVHSDHRSVAEACISAFKWFRCPRLRAIAAYEVPSETTPLGWGRPFKPNWYVDISTVIDAKLRALDAYESETAAFPFPRSRKAVSALATLRGAECGAQAAEAFEIVWSYS